MDLIFRVPLLLSILGGRRGVDDGGVHDGTLGEPHPFRLQVGVDFPEDPLAKAMGLKQMAELADRRLVRNDPRYPSLCQQAASWTLCRRGPLRHRGR